MAKLFFILFATLALQTCVTIAQNAEEPMKTNQENPQNDQADPSLNNEPHKVPEAKTSDDQSLQGQRQKRFYDYFDFDIPRLGSYNFQKRDDSQYTGVPGTHDFMYQILRRVQTILSYTRQQAQSPPFAHYPVPTFIPFYYSPRMNCECNTPEAPGHRGTQGTTARPTQPSITPPTYNPEAPGHSGTQGTTARPTQPSITPPTSPQPPADTTTQVPVEEPSRQPTDSTEIIPTLPSRMGADDEDGTRPISFVPVQPKRPLSKPPPPVDHGSTQESRENKIKKFSNPITPPAAAASTQLPSQPLLPTNSVPTLCDGAVLTCCHQSEVTYNCFKSQGCPNPSSPDNPCGEGVILRVVEKFQYYYANRRG